MLPAPTMVQAADTIPGPNEVELGYGRDTLDRGYGSWNNVYLDAEHRFGKRQSLYGELRQTRRFDLSDREISAGYYHPFDSAWTGQVEASASPDHHVLPKDSLLGQVQKSFEGGWNVQASLRHTRYPGTSANVTVLGGERYWNDFRAEYNLFLSKLPNAGTASSHNVQISFYYTGTGRDYLTLGVAHGRQTENLGNNSGILVTDVTSTSLYGRHWMNLQWGVSYEATVEHLGSLYTRKGVRLGLRRVF